MDGFDGMLSTEKDKGVERVFLKPLEYRDFSRFPGFRGLARHLHLYWADD